MQLSRDLNPETLKGRIRITYSPTDSTDRGEAQPPTVEYTTQYTRENRALEIRPLAVLVTATSAAALAIFALRTAVEVGGVALMSHRV